MSTTGRQPATLDVAAGWLWAERAAWTAGIVAVSVWAAVVVSGSAGARRDLDRFEESQFNAGALVSLPDQRLWSAKRMNAWLDTLNREAPAPLAVLRIPRIGLEVAVLEGTDDWTLNRAVGHIEDTAPPGAEGNSGIAGHRDGFFRGLKDIQAGDCLELETLGHVDGYRVERTWIVEPDDVSVLDSTASASITLVTCYPFYFVGPAPQRFIVRAVRTESTTKRRATE